MQGSATGWSPHRTQTSTGYKPALARWVRARDRHCRFPGCRRPARGCDLDHGIAYLAGTTHHTNLAALCRYHHRLNTHTNWKVRMLPGAVLAWTSPRGHTYHTSLDDPWRARWARAARETSTTKARRLTVSMPP